MIKFFQNNNGSYPVADFLDGLSSKQAQKVTWVMRLVEEMHHVPTQYFKKLGHTDDLWEIRVQISGNIFRILGFFADHNRFIAAHGFQKKTQETPRNEILIAEKRKFIYMKQHGDQYV